MDQKAGDDGRLTPLEQIKAEHEMLRARILDNFEDEFDVQPGIQPQQIGLQMVWADANGELWVILPAGDKWKLKRLCQ